jgi:hypothetical protein
VRGLRVDDGIGVVGDHPLDLRRRDVGVLTAEEQESRAARPPQVSGDAAAVEADRGVEPATVQRCGPREAPTHAEPRHADPGGAELSQRAGGGRHIGEGLFGHERTDQRGEVGGLGAAAAEEEVRGDGRVALPGQSLADPQELRADAPALVDHDDPGPGARDVGE